MSMNGPPASFMSLSIPNLSFAHAAVCLAATADGAFLLCVAQAVPSKPCPVLFLPDDAVRLVELYLRFEDVISFSSTCRSLRWR
jgi:hypothetical protein